jgi:hypothetical protein
MNTMKNLGRELIRTAVIWGLVFGAVPPGGAQEKTKAQESAKKTDAAAQLRGTHAQTVKTTESSAPAAEKSGAPQEGITVHGHWTITIRNEDGSVASRQEFSNALRQPYASVSLASLLSRSQAISEWLILLVNNTTGGEPCLDSASLPPRGDACGIAEHLSDRLPFSGPQYTAGLSVKPDPTNSSNLLLIGTTRASNDGLITVVQTWLSLCPGAAPSSTGCPSTQTFAPFSDAYSSSGAFTAVSVKKNQAIDVTVSFSFQ